jgi:hypothetical protein
MSWGWLKYGTGRDYYHLNQDQISFGRSHKMDKKILYKGTENLHFKISREEEKEDNFSVYLQNCSSNGILIHQTLLSDNTKFKLQNEDKFTLLGVFPNPKTEVQASYTYYLHKIKKRTATQAQLLPEQIKREKESIQETEERAAERAAKRAAKRAAELAAKRAAKRAAELAAKRAAKRAAERAAELAEEEKEEGEIEAGEIEGETIEEGERPSRIEEEKVIFQNKLEEKSKAHERQIQILHKKYESESKAIELLLT